MWFQEHTWLTYCETQSKVYCFYCRSAYLKQLLTFSTKADKAFTVQGFSNWKKAKSRFRSHEKSLTHREACMKIAAIEGPTIITQINSQLKKEQQHHRNMLLVQLSSLRYLTKQGLAIRGHEEKDGNLIQLLECRSEKIPELHDWLTRQKYLSHDIVNEMIELLAHHLLRDLLIDIREAEWFSLISDETRDISVKEQLVVTIRWVDTNYKIHEDLIGLVAVDQTDAGTLSLVLKDSLLRSTLSLSQCRGQCYDGAANMAGHLNGVATRLLEEEPRALFVHCLAHALNLCLQDCGSQCNIVRDALHLTSEISNMIRASPKRLSSFTLLKDELAPGSHSPSLRPLCPTRWTVRNGAIKAVIANYSIIIQELDIIANEKHNETGSKAAGLIILMEKFASYFGLKLSYLVFSITEQLSSTFQNSHLNAQEAIAATKTTQSYLKSLRSDKEFNEFYLSTVKEAKDITDEPILPRQKRLPQRYDDGSINYNYTSPQEYYRRLYYEVLDLLVNELSRRFDQKTFDILEEFERLLLDSCNGTTVLPSSSF